MAEEKKPAMLKDVAGMLGLDVTTVIATVASLFEIPVADISPTTGLRVGTIKAIQDAFPDHKRTIILSKTKDGPIQAKMFGSWGGRDFAACEMVLRKLMTQYKAALRNNADAVSTSSRISREEFEQRRVKEVESAIEREIAAGLRDETGRPIPKKIEERLPRFDQERFWDQERENVEVIRKGNYGGLYVVGDDPVAQPREPGKPLPEMAKTVQHVTNEANGGVGTGVAVVAFGTETGE
jgi:hypothetical protein